LSGVDDITVKLEVKNGFISDQAAVNRLRSSIFEEIKDATLLRSNVEICPPGSIPRSEGKAKRVVDLRRL
ncbi:MAG: phenylacetate--CoA ligase, partial [Candidatus Methanosuratincola petrocarbonis]